MHIESLLKKKKPVFDSWGHFWIIFMHFNFSMKNVIGNNRGKPNALWFTVLFYFWGQGT